MTSDSWASTPNSRATMLGNGPRDTKPEVAIRRGLHARGLRYRVDFRIDLGGMRFRPDIVFTRRKVAIFIDGCFWHSCPIHATTPKRNSDYWGPKLARNIERDRSQTQALLRAGWTSIRVWEHEPAEMVLPVIASVLGAAT